MLEGRVMNHRSLKQICRACAIGALPLLLAGVTACTSSNTVANGDNDALCDAAERHYRSSHETAFQYYRTAVNRGSIRAMCKLAERLTQEADVSAPDKRKAYAAEAVDVATRGTRMTDADYGWRAGCYVALARLYNDRKYGVYNRSKAIDCARTAARVNPCDFCNNFYSEIAGGPAGPQSPQCPTGKTFSFSAPYTLGYRIDGSTFLDDFYASTKKAWPWRSNKHVTGSRGGQEYNYSSHEYRKTGPQTAILIVENEMYAGGMHPDRGCFTYSLRFTEKGAGEYSLTITGNPGSIGAQRYEARGHFTMR